jgi:membrane-bound inhibitor of C-type lysozyme
MGSPWWEQYDIRDTYRCPDQRTLVVERNDAQASLLSGRFRSTLFRETSEAPGIRYQDGRMRLILRGDELTLEELPQRLTCIRTEEV